MALAIATYGLQQAFAILARAPWDSGREPRNQEFQTGVASDLLLEIRQWVQSLGSRLVTMELPGAEAIQNDLLALSIDLERWTRIIEIQAGVVGPTFIMDMHWFGQHGSESDLGRLAQVREWAEAIDREAGQAVADAEHKIIWRVAQDDARWLTVNYLPWPQERLWLVTALLARILEARAATGRGDVWGRADAEPEVVVTAEQERALIRLLKHSDGELRAEAAIALGEGGGRRAAVDALARLAGEDLFVTVRIQAFRALGVLGGPRAFAKLLELLGGERDEHALVTAVHSLHHLLEFATANQLAAAADALRRKVDEPDCPLLPREMARRTIQLRIEQQPD